MKHVTLTRLMLLIVETGLFDLYGFKRIRHLYISHLLGAATGKDNWISIGRNLEFDFAHTQELKNLTLKGRDVICDDVLLDTTGSITIGYDVMISSGASIPIIMIMKVPMRIITQIQECLLGFPLILK